MGRSLCCDKVGLKKGPWTPEEDQKLLAYIEEQGHGSWRALPAKAGLQRCGKSCRLRWTNYLRPDIKRGKFSLQEEQTIIQLHALLGNRWSAIATHLQKRTDNEIKNYWNTHLKKRLAKMGIDPVTHQPKNDVVLPPNEGAHSKNAANLSHMAQWESARLEAEARLAKQSKLRSSNSFSQLSSASTSSAKPVAPPQCLDILKAWSGVWSTTNKSNDQVVGGGGGLTTRFGGQHDLESPKSTVSFSENALTIAATGIGNSGGCGGEGGVMKEEGEEDWRGFGNWTNLSNYKDGMDNTVTFRGDMTLSLESAWSHESLKTGTNEHVNCENFVEGFTELLLNSYGGRSGRSLSDAGGETDNGSGSEYHCDDSNNYWNSILNLVNSSPADSPMF